MATDWPALSDVTSIASAMGVTITTAVIPSAVQQQILSSVIETVNTKTRRDFVITTATRTFDGNGTGLLEVDEYVTISSVAFVNYFGTSAGITIDGVKEVHENKYPKTKLQIFQSSMPGLYRTWIDKFPEGRSNVEIVAAWGYGSTIPADLWLGVAYQAAAIMINWRMFNTAGYLIKWQEADVTEVRNYMDPFTFFKSGTTFKGLIRSYKKPASQYFRKQARPIV